MQLNLKPNQRRMLTTASHIGDEQTASSTNTSTKSVGGSTTTNLTTMTTNNSGYQAVRRQTGKDGGPKPVTQQPTLAQTSAKTQPETDLRVGFSFANL